MPDHSTSQLDKIRPLDPAIFERLREREFSPSLDYMGLSHLRERAMRERDLRELYRGRAPYELLQNAADANATKALYILTSEGLAFIHNGEWFTGQNFSSLAQGWSDKDPEECIGHKGIGFRSVLDMTPAPHLIQINPHNFFGIKFSWAYNYGHIFSKMILKQSRITKTGPNTAKYVVQLCLFLALLKREHLRHQQAPFLTTLLRSFSGSRLQPCSGFLPEMTD